MAWRGTSVDCNKDKPAYAFLRLDEEGVKIKLSNYLDDFKSFCHYGFFPDEESLQMLKETGVVGWNGNDTWYYIMQHDTWGYMNLNDVHVSAS